MSFYDKIWNIDKKMQPTFKGAIALVWIIGILIGFAGSFISLLILAISVLLTGMYIKGGIVEEGRNCDGD